MPEDWEYNELLDILDVLVDLQDRMSLLNSDSWDDANVLYRQVLPTEKKRAAHQRKLRKYQEEAALIGRVLGIAIPDWRAVTPRVFHLVLIPLYAQVASLKRIEPEWE